ncbi:MAG: GTPase HflX [Opitutales bacterium]|nr:GTPase HflX [Opitutales bacterium]
MNEVRDDPALVERALLVGIERQGQGQNDTLSMLAELVELVETLTIKVVETTWIKLRQPQAAYLLGEGQANDIVALAKANECDVIVFDDELTAGQQRNWERLAGCLVIDRQEVIIDIFARRAQTREAKLQVELARMEYNLPRLKRAWTHLSRQRGGGVTQRGEGETQLELDQRFVRSRIAKLKIELSEVIRHRKVQRNKRTRIPLPTAAIIGYTNAGKSSILNHLTRSAVLEEDKLFATLDPTSRRLKLPCGQTLILTDTVGFVRKLPHRLVQAFKATLEEAVVADWLIHVVDISQPEIDVHIETTLNVIDELGASANPRLLVFNKLDLLPAGSELPTQLASRFPDAVFSSTKAPGGLDSLTARLDRLASEQHNPTELLIPYDRFDLVNQLHAAGAITRKKPLPEGLYISGNIPDRLAGSTAPYILPAGSEIHSQLDLP